MNRRLLQIAEQDIGTLVVLYYLPDNPMPYATWAAPKKNPKSTFEGHYFDNLEDAKDDFYLRSRRGWGLVKLSRMLSLEGDERRSIVRDFREEDNA